VTPIAELTAEELATVAGGDFCGWVTGAGAFVGFAAGAIALDGVGAWPGGVIGAAAADGACEYFTGGLGTDRDRGSDDYY
jgi:hypothetical protein